MRLAAGSALYCRLIAHLYIHINGSNLMRLSVGSALCRGLNADLHIHIDGKL